MTYINNIVIIGSGPAGLLLAKSCREIGIETTIISPSLKVTWTSNFCFWLDEIGEIKYNLPFLKTWRSGIVFTDENKPFFLEREYALLDSVQFQRELMQDCENLGVKFVEDRIVSIEHIENISIVTGKLGVYNCSIAIDATGNKSTFIKSHEHLPPAYQIAYGQHIQCPLRDIQHHWGITEDSFVFMDFRSNTYSDEVPTFLYVLPLSEDEVFVEETILTTRKDIDIRTLQKSLQEKKSSLGIGGEISTEEFCKIKMGGAVPELDQHVLGFGVAAGLVHPVTGYQITTSINLAPQIASCLKLHIQTPQKAVQEAWKLMWTKERLQKWKLYRIGHEVLCDFDHPQTQSFFDSFFAIEPESLHKFISANGTTTEVCDTMWKVFLQMNWSSRKQLLKSIYQTNALFI